MSEDTVRKRIMVSGRVQGVGYRFFVVEVAGRLGLQGWVRNLPDGRVEAEVEGFIEVVDELIKELRVGPSMSKVSSIDIQELDGSVTHQGFHVR